MLFGTDKRNLLLKGSQALPVCHSYNSRVKTVMIVEQLRNDSDTKKPKWGYKPKPTWVIFSIIPTIIIKDTINSGSYLTVRGARWHSG